MRWALVLPLLVSCTNPVRPTWPPNMDVLESVVALVSEDGEAYCAGTMIVGNRVLTAAHCVESKPVIFIAEQHHFDGSHARLMIRSRVIAMDTENDLAIVTYRHRTPLSVAVHDAILADQVIGVGHPAGIPFVVHFGRVSAETRDRDSQADAPTRWFLVDVGLINGMSGGPIIDHNGQITGVVSFTIGSFFFTHSHLGGCVPAESINRFLENRESEHQ